MGFTPDWGKFWLEALTLLGVIGNMLYTFVTNRSKANSKAIKGLEDHIDVTFNSVSERVDTIELDVREIRTSMLHLPSNHDMQKLHGRISDVSRAVTRIEGNHEANMAAINRNLDMIQRYLLSDGGKKE